ncbi:hypothetical protein CEXT_41951 [Caerostris extrusa]|uniref:Uncharacterized protein n=1 Tax=Caerostris extrusa TaxID=172846 RepID=A0AAV4VVF8_CAEEX|nr:hypothetical protein CEXT_41951 [Caerostris extrusa]
MKCEPIQMFFIHLEKNLLSPNVLGITKQTQASKNFASINMLATVLKSNEKDISVPLKRNLVVSNAMFLGPDGPVAGAQCHRFPVES